jgi:hypothetical protein
LPPLRSKLIGDSLAGKDVTLQPALLEKKHLFSENTLLSTTNRFYERFLNGNWIDPKKLGQLPDSPIGKPNPADFAYTNKEQHRVWQAWISTSTDNPILEIEIKYPAGVLQRPDGRGYLFRLALEWSESEADRANNAFSGELKQADDTVQSVNEIQPLKLSIPTQSADEL